LLEVLLRSEDVELLRFTSPGLSADVLRCCCALCDKEVEEVWEDGSC